MRKYRIIKSRYLVVDAGFCHDKRTGARRIFREMGDGLMQVRKPMHVGNNPYDPSRLIKTIQRRVFYEKYYFEEVYRSKVQDHALGPGVSGPFGGGLRGAER